MSELEIERISGAGIWDDLSTGVNIVFHWVTVNIDDIKAFFNGFYQGYNKK
ncbi:hypothetical protein LPH50_09255 [Xylella taiwanensis]|nr:hypothetical protein [Xylella taiwanensis]MCD8465175.1 hypothetical protein [Xylella taiwanensis]MCD8467264.1 hypothetical protein [Xylella taiwanensis]MCD8470398.1 hypothetical protein [Xylella taiwanensis]MCD8473470.1 hypothetical protein [Xylella taiwanensis]UFM93298.1 hypothetical protein LPH39_09275 [Xylella taiwanensis]